MQRPDRPRAGASAVRRYAPLLGIASAIALLSGIFAFVGDDDGAASRRGGARAPSTDAIGASDVPVIFDEAEAAGTLDEYEWGDTCDLESGRIAMPNLGAAPCVPAFTGDNGGATSPGVTADTIRVAYYVAAADPQTEALLKLAGAYDERADVEKTMLRYAAIYQQMYELYGRTVELVPLEGTGNDEAAARADAIRAAKELDAFAVLGGPTQSKAFAEELAANGVLCLGSCLITQPEEFYVEHSPYIWATGPSPDQTAAFTTELIEKQLLGGKAEHAGDPAMHGRERVFGLLTYDTPDGNFAPAWDGFKEMLADAGVDLATHVTYFLDLAKAQEDSRTLVTKLKNAGVTTVIFTGDPIMPRYFTEEATAQDFHPEWVMAGTVYADTDVFVWRNDGTPFAGPWPANQVGSSTDYIVSVDVADLNRDSWPDLVTGDDGDNVNAWQNDGSPFQATWPSHLIGQSANDLECVATVDLDNDQWIDVATGNDATMVQAWRNDTSPFVGGWTGTLIGTSPDHIQSLTVGDLDNNGWTDVVTGDDSGKVVAWENPMAPFGQNWAPLLVYPDGDYVHGLALADLDGDGDLDLVAGDEDRLIVVCENLHAADPTPTSTVVASSANPSKVGQAVTFSATVTPVSGGGTPTGTVQFAVDGAPLGPPVVLAGGAAASTPTSALAAGERAVTAAYGGDTTFAASVSAPLTQTVRAFDAPGDFTVGGMLGVGLAAPERAVHIRGANAVFRMDRDRDTAAFILARTDATGVALKTFVVGVNASASGTGSFVVNDLGAATGGAGSNRLTIADDGDAVFAGSLTAKGFFPPSGRALKTDVRPLGEALERVLRLQGVRYTSRLTGAPELGLIAEDADAVVGGIVSAPSDAVATIGIDYARLTPLLVEAVKRQQEAIRTLRLRNRNLESLLKELQEFRRREVEE